MVRANDAEVAVVESGDPGDPESLGDDDETGIGATETEVGVSVDQLGYSVGVTARDHLDLEFAIGQGTEEVGFCGRAELASDQVAVSAMTSAVVTSRSAAPITWAQRL